MRLALFVSSTAESPQKGDREPLRHLVIVSRGTCEQEPCFSLPQAPQLHHLGIRHPQTAAVLPNTADGTANT